MPYDNSNRGAVWKNDRRSSEKHPHLTGTCDIDGTEYFVNIWKNDVSENPKKPILSLSFSKKQLKAPAEPQAKPLDVDFEDIPF
jgi:hypothetical protein